MHFRAHHEPLFRRPHRQGGRPEHRAALFLWAMTCFLLSLVSAIYTFGGTAGEPGGLLGRIATVGFLVLALVMFIIRRLQRDHR